jgi:NADPH:quinone reductase-like Zn-dependent oxidoreductase
VYGTSAAELATLNVRTLYRKGLTIFGYANIVEPIARQHGVLRELFPLLRSGALVVPHEIIPLSDAATAHQRLLERSVRGKLVIDCRR